MKRRYILILSVLILISISALSFGANYARFVPKDHALFCELYLRGFVDDINNIGNKLIDSKTLNKAISQINIGTRMLLGYSIFNKQHLNNMGIDLSRKAGFTILNSDKITNYIFGIPFNNENNITKALTRAMKNIHKSEYKTKSLTYNGRIINIYYVVDEVQPEPAPDEVKTNPAVVGPNEAKKDKNKQAIVEEKKDEKKHDVKEADKEKKDEKKEEKKPVEKILFTSLSMDGYIFISNSSDNLLKMIRAYDKQLTMEYDEYYKIAVSKIGKNNFISFFQNPKKSIDMKSIMKFLPKRLQKLPFTFSKSNALNYLSAGVYLKDDKLKISVCGSFNKYDKNVKDLKKAFVYDKKGFNFLQFVPGNASGIVKMKMEVSDFFKFVFNFMNREGKFLQRYIYDISEDFSFDIQKKLLYNLGKQFHVVVYKVDPLLFVKKSIRKYLPDTEFLAFGEIKDQNNAKQSIDFIINYIKDNFNVKNIEDRIKQIEINGVKFFKVSASYLSVFIGVYRNHIVVSTKEYLLKELLDNVDNIKRTEADNLITDKKMKEKYKKANLFMYLNNEKLLKIIKRSVYKIALPKVIQYLKHATLCAKWDVDTGVITFSLKFKDKK